MSAVEPGRCAFCGCTEENACNAFRFARHAAPMVFEEAFELARRLLDDDVDDELSADEVPFGQCSWANEDRTLCTVCDAALKRLSELPEIGYERAIELTEQTREALRAIRALW
jgi:radical SAM superfamily enzyme YgiQ (UPF0313 family)